MKRPFEEVSDGKSSEVESVATDSTVEEPYDSEKLWEVDEILAERPDPRNPGSQQYLVKWTGFELHDATWEPEENLGDNGRREWLEKKKNVDEGWKPAFDLKTYEDAKKRFEDQKKRRKDLRHAKRVKNGHLPKSSPSKELINKRGTARVTKKGDGNPSRTGNYSFTSDSDVIDVAFQSPEEDSEDDMPITASRVKRRQGQSFTVSDISKSNDKPSKPATKRIQNTSKRSGQDLTITTNVLGTLTAPSSDLRSKKLETSTKGTASKSKGIALAPPKNAIIKEDLTKSSTPFASNSNPSNPTPAQSSTSAAKLPPPPSSSIAQSSTILLTESKAQGSASAIQKISKTAPAVKEDKYRNWYDKQERRKRQTGENLSLYRISAQYKAAKKAEEGAIADASSIPLIDPETSQIVQSARPNRSLAQAPRVVEREPSPVTVTPNKFPAKAGFIPRTCPYWKDDPTSCPSGQTCYFKHHLLDPPQTACLALFHQVADCEKQAESHYKYKYGFYGESKTCQYWLRGGCTRKDTECWHAHWNIPPSGIELHGDTLGKPGPLLPRHMMTCYFWKQGHCSKSAQKCDYAHEQMSVDAPPPPPRRTISSVRTPILQLSTEDRHYPSVHESQIETGQLRGSGAQPNPQALSGGIIYPERQVLTEHSPMSVAPLGRPSGEQATDVAKPKFFFEMILRRHESPLHENCINVSIAVPADVHEYLLIHAGTCPTIDLRQMIQAEQAQNFLGLSTARAAAYGPVKVEGFCEWFEQTLEKLRLHLSGAAARLGPYLLLLLPKKDEWDFLQIPTENQPTGPPASLLFYLHVVEETLGPPADRVELVENKPWLHQYLSSVLCISPEVFFMWLGEVLGKRTFLFVNDLWVAERDMFLRYFREIGATVWRDWATFRETIACKEKSGEPNGGVVIIHPDFHISLISELSEFRSLLRARCNFFRLGTHPVERTFICRKVFVGSQATYITNDVFVKSPELALEIIKMHVMNSWRLILRPKILDWIGLLAHGEKKNLYLQIYDEIDHLSGKDPADILVDLFPDDEGDHEDRYLQDSGTENSRMVKEFAFWSFNAESIARRFEVVHPVESEMTQWKNEWQHIGFETPENFLRLFNRRKAAES